VIDTGPGWVRIKDFTPEIEQRMDKAASMDAAYWGELGTYKRERQERIDRLSKESGHADQH
jgi:hypothetical protein